jgi:hypothetical protein
MAAFVLIASIMYCRMYRFRSWMPSTKLCTPLFYCMCVRDIDSSPTLTINRRSDLHDVLEIVYRCEDCSSAIYLWTSVYSHLMCRKIEQFR